MRFVYRNKSLSAAVGHISNFNLHFYTSCPNSFNSSLGFGCYNDPVLGRFSQHSLLIKRVVFGIKLLQSCLRCFIGERGSSEVKFWLITLSRIFRLPVILMPHGVKSADNSRVAVWFVLRHSEETEAAQSGRMYFIFFGRNLTHLFTCSDLRRALRPRPHFLFTFLRGIGIPMEMVSATPCLTAYHQNMPNTTLRIS